MKKTHIYAALPEGYQKNFSFKFTDEIDIVKDLSHLEILIAALLFLFGLFIHPLSSIKERSYSFDSASLRIFLIPAAVFLYLFLHECTHIFFMKLFGAEKVLVEKSSGFTATGSAGYYDKFSFSIISLAPVILWGIIFSFTAAVVPVRWFWVIYPMLIINFSGSSSDYYAVFLSSKSPSDSLIQDSGLEFSIYSKKDSQLSEV